MADYKRTFEVLILLLVSSLGFTAEQPVLQPIVEVEEEVYRYSPANNGAGPMWCRGSTCLVRIGDDVFASGIETLEDFKPLNNCRWMLFRRDTRGWQQVQVNEVGRTREPCPLTGFSDGTPVYVC